MLSHENAKARSGEHGTSNSPLNNGNLNKSDPSKATAKMQGQHPEHVNPNFGLSVPSKKHTWSSVNSQQPTSKHDDKETRLSHNLRQVNSASKNNQQRREPVEENVLGSDKSNRERRAFGNLKHDHRMLQETNRALRDDLRDLEQLFSSSENDFIAEVTALTRDKKQQVEQLKEKSRAISGLEKQIAQLQEYSNRQAQAYRRDINRLRQDLTQSSRQLEDLEEDKDGMARALEKCKDRIFNAQPLQGMADTQLRDMYTDMCNSIDYWVDTHFADAEKLLDNLLTADGSQGAKDLVGEYFNLKDLVAVQENPPGELMLLQSLVSRHLYVTLLDECRIFPGLCPETEDCLYQVTNGLSNLDPAKDPEAIQMWRVDLQRALNTVESVKAARELDLQEIAVELSTCFEVLSRIAGSMPGEHEQCLQFVLEAAGLANNIRQSMALYDFDFGFASEREAEGDYVVTLEHLKRHSVIDSRTGSTLRPTAVQIAGPDGRVGTLLLVVHPAFVRKAKSLTDRIVLAKSTIVVKFDQPVPRGGKGKA